MVPLPGHIQLSGDDVSEDDRWTGRGSWKVQQSPGVGHRRRDRKHLCGGHGKRQGAGERRTLKLAGPSHSLQAFFTDSDQERSLPTLHRRENGER